MESMTRRKNIGAAQGQRNRYYKFRAALADTNANFNISYKHKPKKGELGGWLINTA